MRVKLLLVPVVLLAALLPAGPASAVVGGSDATRAYPHMAALERDGSFICGGSLVAPGFVLTAAHCVADEPGAAYRVGLGSADRTAPAERIDVAQVTVHESYGRPTAASNDVALLRLASPSAQAPIAVLEPGEEGRWAPGKTVTVIGWGTRVTNDVIGVTATERLQEVSVPRQADATCSQSYGGGFEASSELCAGELLGLKDSCQGDSGGPLMVDGPAGVPALVGVVSFGTGCGLPTQYGVYARVAASPLRDWVTSRLPSPAPVSASGPASAPDRPATAPAAPMATSPAASSPGAKRAKRSAASRRRACYAKADRTRAPRARRAAQKRCTRLYGRRR